MILECDLRPILAGEGASNLLLSADALMGVAALLRVGMARGECDQGARFVAEALVSSVEEMAAKLRAETRAA